MSHIEKGVYRSTHRPLPERDVDCNDDVRVFISGPLPCPRRLALVILSCTFVASA